MSLLQRIAAKDQNAVQECLDRYGGLVWSLARKMTPRGNDPEDAVQEIFIDLWKNADRYSPEVGEETVFVAMIARRRLIDRLRKAQRTPETALLDNEDVGANQKQLDASVDASLAMKALNTLKPEQRKMLSLSLKYGMSHGEIATATQTAVGTVKSHIRRGLATLRQALHGEGGQV